MTQAKSAQPSLYELVGGEAGLERLIERFYDIIEFETHPEAPLLHVLHLRGHGVAHSRIEQFNYLSGFFGGPNLYAQKYGHANLHTMHDHVEIPPQARDAWLHIMDQAIDDVGLQPDVKTTLMRHFTRVAEMLVNRPE